MQGPWIGRGLAVGIAVAALALPAGAAAEASSSASCVGGLASAPAPGTDKAAFVQAIPKPRGAAVSGFARSETCALD